MKQFRYALLSGLLGALLAAACFVSASCATETAGDDDERRGAPACFSSCTTDGLCDDNRLCDCEDDYTCVKSGQVVGPAACCRATSTDDCAASMNCEISGQCSLGAGMCGASSDYDCAHSLACFNLDHCYACPDGQCDTEEHCGG
jgi:hypothetical protein